MKRDPRTILFALLFTIAVTVLGCILLGTIVMFLFGFGFIGGFLLWLLVPAAPTFAAIKIPYLITLGFFAAHKFEERHFDFFPALSKITGIPAPESGSPLAVLLYAFAAFWLLIPYLIGRRIQFGYFLAWTFFASMGITELAHFAFPFFNPEGFGYFPGIVSAALLVPAAWLGLWRLSRS